MCIRLPKCAVPLCSNRRLIFLILIPSSVNFPCIGEILELLSAWPLSVEGPSTYSVLQHLDLSECNLLELSDRIAHLSSLTTLKLCRNNLESLPVTMNRLGCLTHLGLEACKKLKSIPELSSSIYYIDAHDCTALEIVSKPKPPTSCHTQYLFKFSNCLQLIQTNLFRDIIETHLHLQEGWLRPLRLKISLPGSEVPNWFNHRSEGFSLPVKVPAPNWFGSNLLGFAVCAVVGTCQGINDDTSSSSFVVLCTFKGNCGEFSNSFNLLDPIFESDRFYTSDHMLLGYLSWSDCCSIEQGKLAKEAFTQANFEIIPKNLLRIKSCGVRFVYADPDPMLDLNMPPPQVHVDSFCESYESRNKETERVEISREIDLSESSSCRPRSIHGNCMEVPNGSIAWPTVHVQGLGAPFFPHQMEIRRIETEWGPEAAAGSGTCQTSKSLPEPQTERKEEDEIMVVVENGKGCRVLGSVCSCLSLSGCAMSVKCRETEREEESLTRVYDGVDISELGSHSGLVVPNSQIEGQEEKGVRVTMVASNADILELGSNSGLVVPKSQIEGQEEKEGDGVTMVSSNADILELGSHSDLVVPNSQYEGQEERDIMGGEESLPARGLLGQLCSCFYQRGKRK